MSAFSECCRQLLLESGSNVYQIAKQSGLDRTSIQRMITGKRMPSIQFVEKFCSHLRITPIERTELLELYKIEKIGKELYQNRLYIKTMIESMRPEQSYNAILTLESARKMEDISLNQDIFTDSQNETANLLEYILFKELRSRDFTRIRTNLPVTYKTFFNLLQRIRNTLDRSFRLQHLFILNKAPSLLSKANYNLEVLHEVLPFVSEFPDMYFPRYIYSKSTPGDDYYYIYPYYLITTNYVFCISSDLKKAALYPSGSVVAHYQTEFDRLYATSSPLTYYQRTSKDHLEYVIETIANSGSPSHISSRNFYLPASSRQRLMADQPFKHFFSMEGLKRYCSGNASEIIKKRILVMNYLTKCKNEEILGYVFKDTFDFPENLTLLLYDTLKLILLFSPASKDFSITITIEESSVCKSFLDFFDSMEESDLVFSNEETLKLLADSIEP